MIPQLSTFRPTKHKHRENYYNVANYKTKAVMSLSPQLLLFACQWPCGWFWTDIVNFNDLGSFVHFSI